MNGARVCGAYRYDITVSDLVATDFKVNCIQIQAAQQGDCYKPPPLHPVVGSVHSSQLNAYHNSTEKGTAPGNGRPRLSQPDFGNV